MYEREERRGTPAAPCLLLPDGSTEFQEEKEGVPRGEDEASSE
jgi:hypothetical protein